MEGFIVIAPKWPDFSFVKTLLNPNAFICAADSGLDFCRAHDIVPNLIVGDMDSLSDQCHLDDYDASKIIRHPMDKDETDTEIALRELYHRKISPITILGGGEGRLDHLWGLINLFSKAFSPARWITALEVVTVIPKNELIIIKGEKDQLISFFSVGNDFSKCRTNGLQWELTDFEWSDHEMGISNRFLGNTVELFLESGTLVMIRPIHYMNA